MKLPIIDEREAVPVRLLPFLTNWLPLSPDVIANLFCGRHPFNAWRMRARLLQEDGGAHHEIPPGAWDNVAEDMAAIEHDTKANGQDDPSCLYRSWRSEALTRLPVRAFVWRDELEAEYARTYGPIRFYRPRHVGESVISDEQVATELAALVAASEGKATTEDEAEGLVVVDVETTATEDGKLNFDAVLLTQDESELVLDGFGPVMPRTEPDVASEGAPLPARVPLMIQNRVRVLDALRAANFDPMALPHSPPGKSCPAKAVARIGAKLSRDSFEHAWKALLADGELHRT